MIISILSIPKKKKRRKRMFKWPFDGRYRLVALKLPNEPRSDSGEHTLVNLCEITHLPLTRSVCRHALLCPRHRSIQRSLGGPPQREHLRSNDPGIGYSLNSSKFVKSLPLSGLSSTHRMRLFSRQKSIPRAFGSTQCRVISG